MSWRKNRGIIFRFDLSKALINWPFLTFIILILLFIFRGACLNSKNCLLIRFQHSHYSQEIRESLCFHILWVQFLVELLKVILFFSQEFHFWIFFKNVTFFVFDNWLCWIHNRSHQENLFFLTNLVYLVQFLWFQSSRFLDQIFKCLSSEFRLTLTLGFYSLRLLFLFFFLKFLTILGIFLFFFETGLFFHLTYHTFSFFFSLDNGQLFCLSLKHLPSFFDYLSHFYVLLLFSDQRR